MTFMLGVEVTRACNFRCRHCFVNAGKGDRAAPALQQLEDLLRRAAASGTGSVGWSGGEPLMRRDLARLTGFAAALGLDVGVASNGYLATAARLRELRDAGLGVVQISLDGPDPARASRYRQGPRLAFERARDAVRSSVELGLQTYVCTLLAPETMADTEEMIALARSLGAHGLRYTIWTPVGRAAGERYDDAEWDGAGLRQFLDGAQRHAVDAAFRVLVDCPTGPLPFSRRGACGAGRETGYVTASGDLYPCTALMYPAYRVGNVFERPFDLLVNDGRMFKVQREVAAVPAGGACAECSIARTCRGGCPGRTYAQFGRARRGGRRLPMPTCFVRLATRTTEART